MIYFYCPRPSRSLQNLRDVITLRTIRTEGSRFKGGPRKNVVNWGCSTPSEQVEISNCLNKPSVLEPVNSKLKFFRKIDGQEGGHVPFYTINKDEAEGWLRDKKAVVIRELLQGSGGDGIVIINNLKDWEEYNHKKAKLYVIYVPKKYEFRLHVFNGVVIDVQQKKLRHGVSDPNWKIRNVENGFIYARENLTLDSLPEGMVEKVLRVHELSGIDFGAYDVIYNLHHKQSLVLEVNTAPGLQGTTLTNYGQAFKDFFRPQREMKMI